MFDQLDYKKHQSIFVNSNKKKTKRLQSEPSASNTIL